MAKCKYPDEVCANMTIYHGEVYCDSVPCSARGEIPPPTNADRIRAMSDEELATWILENIDCDKENTMCCPELYKNSSKCNGRCFAGRLNWLKQEVTE